ncbi:MAG: hypothetical protein H7068_03255 [Pedobacter sp.]|nr:hypothetical protein [Chitinophagaceae bacterium]
MRKNLVFILLLLCFGKGFAQAEKIDSILESHSHKYQPEKVHIHFDKSVYSKGETIWFKAYLFSGTQPSAISKNFYVDFYNAKGVLLKHFVTPIYQSSAKGQFDIPTNFSEGFIHVKAYTQWMLNFDSAFNYTKDIYVLQGAGIKPIQSTAKPIVNVTFLPEGGDLVYGLTSKLAFIAINQFGKPANITGSIITKSGQFVDSFYTQYDGMGSLMITPQLNETYVANWLDESGIKHITQLPSIIQNGINLNVQALSKKAIVLINRSQEIDNNSKTLHLVGFMNQRLVYQAKLNLASKTSVFAEIPTDSLSSGILQITVLNAQLQPLAERIIFINNHNYEFSTNFNVPTKSLIKKGKNIIEIFSQDTIPANLSVSIIDADVTTEKNNIFSQLLLSDDIKGYVGNPSYYFETNKDGVKKNLDLVMLTHGWRKFNWHNAFNGNAPITSTISDSDYIQIKGKTYVPASVKIAPNQQLMLILQAKDSSRQFLMVPLGQDGSFTLTGAIFFDSIRVFYQYLGDKKLEKKSELVFNNGFLKPQFSAINANLWMFNDTLETQRARYLSQKQAELERLMAKTNLQEVIVKSKSKTPMDILDEKYTTGFFSNGDAKQFDLRNDGRATASQSIFDYLQGLVAGLQITPSPDGKYSLNWRGGSPDLYLNEMKVDIDQVINTPMTDIAYVKVFRPPFFGSAFGGASGAIAVYSQKASDVNAFTDKNSNLENQYIEGYSAFKQFYSPQYTTSNDVTTDIRTTLFWKPYIILDNANKSQKIEFYNNDFSKKLRVIIEGVNAAGKLTRTEKIIE